MYHQKSDRKKKFFIIIFKFHVWLKPVFFKYIKNNYSKIINRSFRI